MRKCALCGRENLLHAKQCRFKDCNYKFPTLTEIENDVNENTIGNYEPNKTSATQVASLQIQNQCRCADCNRIYNGDTQSSFCPHSTIIHQEAATGAKRQNLYPPGEKFPVRLDLMMLNDSALRRVGEVYGEGFTKYGAKNWMKGFEQSVLLSHALDHLRFYLGQIKDPKDPDCDHLAHAIWNLWTLCWVEEHKPELINLTNENK